MKRALLVLAACGGGGESKPTPVAADLPAVHVDHRVETLAIIDRLARLPEATKATGPYPRDVDTAMSPFADHPAVAMARALGDKGFGFEQPMNLAIRLDAPPPELADYAAAVKQFATDAKVEEFLTAHERYITKVEDAFIAQIKLNNPVPFFKHLFGETGTHFTVVPALLQGPQSYGIRRDRDAYQLIGLDAVDDQGLPKTIDGDLIVHEMAHSFVNPAVERHAAELDPSATPLFALVQPAMEAQHYATPRIMIDESIVRAVTSLYARTTRGDKAAAAAIYSEVRRGFVWTADLEHVIAKQKPHDFEGMMPAIAAFFAATAKKYAAGLPPLAFLGPIDAVYQHPIAIVATSATRDYAVAINNKLFYGKWPVTTTGSFEQFPGVGLVAYGSAATNFVVASVTKRARWKVAADGITLGTKHWAGEHMLLIATWPRLDDPTQGIVIYTAAADTDVDEANAMHAGPTDWVVGQKTTTGFRILEAGDFPHTQDGAWELP